GGGAVTAAAAAVGTSPNAADARGVPLIHTCRLRGADHASYPGLDFIRTIVQKRRAGGWTPAGLAAWNPYSRMVAPKRSAATATAASRTATPSSLVSVRSAARSSILNANDFRSSPSFASR